MGEETFIRRINSIPGYIVTAVVFIMDYIVVFLLTVVALLFFIGLLLASPVVGLLFALVGSLLVLYLYVGLSQIFADHRGARHV